LVLRTKLPPDRFTMNTIKSLERLQQLHSLIDTECTGPPLEIARKMEISERSVYNLLDYLRDYSALIGYDRGRKTYYYKNQFNLELTISFSVMSNNEVTEILGGSYFLKNSSRI